MAWISAAAMIGGSLLSSSMASTASGNASQSQLQAALAAAGVQEGQFNISQQNTAPYRAAGQTALGNIMNLLGMGNQYSKSLAGINSQDKTNAAMLDAKLQGALSGGPGANKTNLQSIESGHGTRAQYADPLGLMSSSTANTAGKIGDPANILSGPLNSIFGGLATGGHADGGKTYIVGEEGPELLHMAPGSQGYVDPNPATKARMEMGHRAFGGPVFGGGKPATVKWSPGGSLAAHPHEQSPSMILREGFAQRESYSGFPGRAYGGPVGALPHGPIAPGMIHPGMGMRMPLNIGPMGGMRQPGMPMVEARATGGPVGGSAAFNAGTPQQQAYWLNKYNQSRGTGSNSAALSSGQTPTQIMQQDPGYQFRLQQGIQALDASAAASGNLLSGGTGKSLVEFGQGYASNEFNNIYNRLASVAGLGQSTNTSQGYLGAQTGSALGMNLMYGGNAAASGYINQNNAYQNMFGNLGYAYGSGQLNGLGSLFSSAPQASFGGSLAQPVSPVDTGISPQTIAPIQY